MTLKAVWSILKEAGSDWVDDKASRLAAAIAFYTMLSLAPLFILAIDIAGAVFGRDAATRAMTEQLRDLVGDAGAEFARTTAEHYYQPKSGVAATIFGIALLLYSASSVFGELQDSLNTAWDVRPKPGRGIWGTLSDRFLSFGMVLVIGFLLLVTLVITTTIAALSGYLEQLVPGLPTLLQIVNFVLSFLIVTVLFALMFKILPDAVIAWRDVWFGASVTAVLFTVGKYVIGLYLGRGTITTPFGAAGSLVAFVVWVYYSGLILFFGAELTKITAQHAGREIRPAPNAECAKPELGRVRV